MPQMTGNILLRPGYVFVLLVHITASFNYGDPPRIDPPREGIIYGRVGEVIKLPCHVDDHDAFTTWKKDGERITPVWLRFRELLTQLRIKDALEEDSGQYTCTATNGYGSDDITYILYVIGNNTEIPSSPPGGTPPPLPNDKHIPRFDKLEQMSAIQQAPVGSSIRLKCHASGIPTPQITWHKDGQQLHAPYYQRDRVIDQWVLALNNLQVADSGDYKCVVMNTVGTIHFTYSLSVIPRLDSNTIPIIKDPHPTNSTVTYGDTATFQCRVNSPVPPTIQWLKRVDSARDIRLANNTIEIKGNHYIILQTEVSVKDKEHGLYTNKLTIRSATTRDEGKYICLGTNGLGHSMKDAYLTVLDGAASRDGYDHEPDSLMDDHSLLLLIAIPALVIVVVASVAVYCLCKKQKAQEPPKTVLQTTAARAHSKTNAPPDKRPTGFEHQYTAMHPQVYNHYVAQPQGYSAHLVSGGPGGQDSGVYLKNYGGLHAQHAPTPSDVSSSGHRSATPPNFKHAPIQHTHAHYQNCIT